MVVPDECFRDLIYFSSPQNQIGTTNYQFKKGGMRNIRLLEVGIEIRRLGLGCLPLRYRPFRYGGASVRSHARFPEAPLRSRTVGFPESGSDPGF